MVDRLLNMGALVEERVHDATHALIDRRIDTAERIIGSDQDVNELQIEIDERCLRLLALSSSRWHRRGRHFRGGGQGRPAPPRGALTMRQVLLIEDDRDIAEAISYQLDKAGLQVKVARTGEEGLEASRRGADLVLLDLNLPSMDGLEVCRMIRRQTATAHVPIIIVSARSEEVDRVLGLEMGADDYMVKPFSLKELAARCRAALRRAQTSSGPAGAYRDENFEVEFDAYLVRYRGQEVRLTPKEFDLFRYMVERPGRVVTRERLLEHVWGYDTDIETRSIDAHIRRLRLKLGPARDHVETIVGLGYRFVPSLPGSPS